MLVKDVMTRRVEVLDPDDMLLAAARRMRDLGVGALPVCREEQLQGFLTDRDIVVRGVAAGCDPSVTQVRAAMTAQVVECHDDEDLSDAATRLERAAVRRAVVLDAAGRLVGLLSVDDIALRSPALAGEILEHARDPERPVQRGAWPWWEESAH